MEQVRGNGRRVTEEHVNSPRHHRSSGPVRVPLELGDSSGRVINNRMVTVKDNIRREGGLRDCTTSLGLQPQKRQQLIC